MKLVRKLAVLLITIAVLASALAVLVTASGEDKLSAVDSLLQYHCSTVYVDNDMSEAPTYDENLFVALSNDETLTVVKDPKGTDNDTWHIVPEDMRNANIVVGFGEKQSTVVFTTRVMFDEPTDDGDERTEEKAPTYQVFIKMNNSNGLTDTATLFEIDYKTAKIKYRYFNEQTGRLNAEALVDFAPEYNVWYDLDFVFNFESGSYSISVKSDNDEFEATASLGTFKSASEIRMLLSESRLAEFWCDYLEVYAGTFKRELDNVNNKTAELLVAIDALTDTDLTLEEKVAVADAYRTVLIEKGFTPNDATPNLDEITAIIENDVKFMNATYFEAFSEYASKIDVAKSYYDRMDYVDFVNRFDSLLPDEKTEFEALAGIVAGNFERYEEAKALVAAEAELLLAIKNDSDSFIDEVSSFDKANTDFSYMTNVYETLKAFDKRDATYEGVIEASKVYEALGTKIKAIEDTVTKLMQNVKAMADVVDALETVQCGDAFETVYYTNYLTALKLYNGGDIYEGFDNATYNGLTDSIAKFLSVEEYLLERVKLSREFITLINQAKNSTQYQYIKNKLDEAAPYIDGDIANKSVEPKYEGVSQAILDYNQFRQKLAEDKAASEAYVAEVAKIANANTYAAKKAAVAAALAKKAAGDILGLPGVKEANIALSNAQSEIDALTGYSATLIDCVEKLNAENNSLTVEERRELIVIASNAKDKSTEEISGVKEAKSGLESAISKYNSDIAAANAALEGAVVNASAACASGTSATSVQNVFEIIKALFSKGE